MAAIFCNSSRPFISLTIKFQRRSSCGDLQDISNSQMLTPQLLWRSSRRRDLQYKHEASDNSNATTVPPATSCSYRDVVLGLTLKTSLLTAPSALS